MKYLRVVCCLFLGSLIAASASAASRSFYVDPGGKDSNPGTQEAPFATPARAAQAALGATGDRVDVYFHAGLYRLEAPLVLKNNQARSISFRALPGAEVIFSGGRRIQGWKALDHDQWAITIPEIASGAWRFRQLFSDGTRLPRGRFPNGEALLHLKAVNKVVTKMTLDQPVPVSLSAEEKAELVVIQNWSISRALISSSEGAQLKIHNPVGWIGHAATTANAGKPAFLENAAAFVDSPGEWYLNETTGQLLYQGAPGEDPNTKEFVAPYCERLLDLQGRPGAPLQRIRFKGIHFQTCAWKLPDFGYAGIQAGHYGPDFKKPVYVLPSAIRLYRCEACCFEECRVSQTGANAMALGAGSKNNIISNTSFEDIGGNGILVGWRGALEDGRIAMEKGASLAADWSNLADRPLANRIEGNRLRQCGAVSFGAVAIFDAYCEGTVIRHNLIQEMPYTGISIGFRWDSSETTQRDTLVEYNHVHDIMQKLADGGAIYTLGYQPGTILRGNLLHDVHRSAYAHGGAPNNGVFFDQGSKALHVEKNIIYATSGKAIRFNQCTKEMLSWEGNAFDCSPEDPAFPKALAQQAGPASLKGR